MYIDKDMKSMKKKKNTELHIKANIDRAKVGKMELS